MTIDLINWYNIIVRAITHFLVYLSESELIRSTENLQ